MKNPFMLIRVLTAMILFLILAQANLWADTRAHLILAVGYRAFLLAAPFFLYLGLSNGMRLALGIGVASMIFSLFSFNSFALGCFAISMAVSGYICKDVNSHSSQGAADNKVALNIGSLMAGLLVMFFSNKNLLLSLSAISLTIAFYYSFRIDWNKVANNDLSLKETSKDMPVKKDGIPFIPLLGWSLIGIATGIKLTGVFTILPQFLIHQTGALPSWFGSLIIINSLGVVFLQHFVLKFLDNSKKDLTLFFSCTAMLLLAAPALFHVEYFWSSMVWIALLTLGECALSRYDRIAKEEGFLFPKEVMVGIGSFITVILSRDFPNAIYISGLFGTFCLLLGFALTRVPSSLKMRIGTSSVKNIA
jgi:hypothetical protein